MKEFELLAPAGDMKSAYAAISAGADAIYVGAQKFSARAFASNFSEEDLISLIKYAHLFDVKIYLAVNTLFKEFELKELTEYLKRPVREGLDAVIVQDLGAIRLISETFPMLSVHASTQMTVTTSYEAEFLGSIGVDRVVLARELSLDEIKCIADNTDMELECFIHGAMCYSYSGRCLMSSYLGGRSANRGRCAGPCRLDYEALGKKGSILSMKDMMTGDDSYKLVQNGVYSLKIEGRMKNPKYVYSVTSAYRAFLDGINGKNDQANPDHFDKLSSLYTRGSGSVSYLYCHNDKDMICSDFAGYTGSDASDVDEDLLIRKCHLRADISIYRDLPVYLNLYMNDKVFSFASDYICQSSIKRPVTRSDIENTVLKTGDTPFVIDDIIINSDNESFVPNSVLKELRRNALKELLDDNNNSYIEENINKHKDTIHDHEKHCINHSKINEKDACNNSIVKDSIATERKVIEKPGHENGSPDMHKPPEIFVSVRTFEQFDVLADNELISLIYPSYELFLSDEERFVSLLEKAENNGKKVYPALPYIIRQDTVRKFSDMVSKMLDFGITGFLCRDLSQKLIIENDLLKEGADYGRITFHADADIQCFNSLSADMLLNKMGFDLICPGHETASGAIKDLPCYRMVMSVYIHTPLMISANCVSRTCASCDRKKDTVIIRDRQNTLFPVQKYCDFCYNVIRNSVPTCLFKVMDELNDAGFHSYRFDFDEETKDEIESIFDDYLKGQTSFEFTYGHFKKAVQ